MKAAAVITLTAPQREKGKLLAADFMLPHLDASGAALAKPSEIVHYLRAHLDCRSSGLVFVFLLDGEGISLAQLESGRFLTIRAGFHAGSARYRREKGGGKNQMIAKAIGLSFASPPRVLDATAGLGRDAFVLASLGCQVTMLERVPEVRALLTDALRRATEWGGTNDLELLSILKRMRLIESDAQVHMRELDDETRPDVVYLDPMFPPQSKSVQVKKEMHVLHGLVGSDPDAANLLPAAFSCAQRRVVVKRPRLAPPLGSRKVSHTLEGKSNRFDVYVRN